MPSTLRVHDGATPGGTPLARQSTLDGADYVIAYQKPTAANGYTWYRKYKSGWVEQGGILTGNVVIAVGAEANLGAATFPIQMNNINYYAFASGDGYTTLMNIGAATTNCVFKFGAYATSARTLTCVRWYICGIAE